MQHSESKPCALCSWCENSSRGGLKLNLSRTKPLLAYLRRFPFSWGKTHTLGSLALDIFTQSRPFSSCVPVKNTSCYSSWRLKIGWKDGTTHSLLKWQAFWKCLVDEGEVHVTCCHLQVVHEATWQIYDSQLARQVPIQNIQNVYRPSAMSNGKNCHWAIGFEIVSTCSNPTHRSGRGRPIRSQQGWHLPWTLQQNSSYGSLLRSPKALHSRLIHVTSNFTQPQRW